VPVVLASEQEIGRSAVGVETVRFEGEQGLRRLVEESDVVVLQGHAVERWPLLRSARALKVVDLYDPWLLENLENQRSHDRLTGDWIVRRDVDVQRELLEIGDFFVCASERQRDYWLGMLSARGRLDRATYEADPSLRRLIDVLPYGCPEQPPEPGPALKGVHPQVPADAFLVLWGGGTWDWFDPLSVLEAFARLHKELPQARLYFMGLQLPDSHTQPQRVAAQLRARSGELGLDDSVVFGDWVAYDQRGAYLLEADVGILATRPLAEIRLAFRSRLLDHFWAGLPTIATGGDTLTELIEHEQAGIICAPGDTDALTTALQRLAHDPDLRHQMSQNASRLAADYHWPDVIQPLRNLTQQPWHWHTLRTHRATPVSLTEDAQLLLERRRQAAEAHSLPAAIEAMVAPMRRSSLKESARKAGWHTPEPVRAFFRPLLRRLQRRAG
jgi:glycosyltransferase involved in cell wall biosynthesis